MIEHVKKIFNYFLIGVLGVIPIVLVLQIFIVVKNMISGLFFQVYGYVDSYAYTVVVFIISFSLLASIGYSLSKYRSSLVIGFFERVINKIPFVNTVYRVSKKIVKMFSNHEQDDDREVVYVEYPKDGLWVPAYVTNKQGDMYIVYIPTSPNPTSGFTVIVHESKLVKSLLDLEQVTSFIASVGFDYPRKDEEVDRLAQLKPVQLVSNTVETTEHSAGSE
ncbi:MAG TPA: DUF502 domain-containing protein [Crenotrichaceae bacterium]|nr:DUF502 domain-containing protein [Crenotrichaceae bacterium]